MKGEPIFSSKNFKDDPTIGKNMESLPLDMPIFLNDEPQNLINSKKYFQSINKALISQRFHRRYVQNLYILDYDKCKKLLSKIELEETFDERKDNLEGI